MWKEELSTAKKAAMSAGTVLNRLFGKVRDITKKGDIDLVTEADFQAEKIVLSTLSHKFPGDSILAEESGTHQQASKRTWIVDPLDGTTNFVHGFPMFAVSIALEIEQEMVLGVVYNPFMNELFEAVKDGGALLNGRPIRVSSIQDLEESLLATGFPYNIRECPEKILGLFQKMIVKAQGVRRPGSAAIDMCYVAMGRLDGFWEQDLKPWDTAAGTVMVTEAGGKLSNYQGGPYTPHQKTVVAANPLIHRKMMEVIGG